MIYYVDANSAITGSGTSEAPFLTIQEAADIALPGDEVVVYPGIYREAVNPVHAGTPEKRITYRSAEKGGEAFEPEQPFENPDGTPIIFDTDYFGSAVGSQVICGPFADRSSWEKEICVWQDQM